MSKHKAPAEGDRIDMGGKLPQFDVFAKFVYRDLVNNSLSWIRVADPKAGKLDDILYATTQEIHAYQMKWSNKQNPTPFSYNDFVPLFIECVSGWKALKVEHASECKKVIAHLLTNRTISSNDSIKIKELKIGSFHDFINEVWKRLKIKQNFATKWEPIINQLKKDCGLSDSEFSDFIEHFEFHPEFVHHEARIANAHMQKLDEDIIQLSRFITEEVADKNKVIHYSQQQLINALGSAWQSRFKTTFNHELVIDKSTYQPLLLTFAELDKKILDGNSGYLFVVGGPGTGKSTLLTDWSKNRQERIVRYYTFDFRNPASLLNDHERGEAVNLFFDLVIQLKSDQIYIGDVQPYKDLVYLKTIFEQQLLALGADYTSNGRQTIIIIDGLDHIPREYTQTVNSFLAHLPKPDLLPKGVFIILGSQSYNLEDLRPEIKLESAKVERIIQIASLERKDVFEYIESGDLSGILSNEQKQLLFKKSQGHPLYLSYLIHNASQSDDVAKAIEESDEITGDIETYYHKIWAPISKNADLIKLLGIIARINDSVSPDFIQEWAFNHQVLLDFSTRAKFLFELSNDGWSFFHNSFRQFLIYNTALNPLTSEFDVPTNKSLHSQLADFYSNSKIEKHWKKAYHLFLAGQLDEFLDSANPDFFAEQFINFRPAEEIRRDIKLGIEVAKHRQNVYLLIRYLFALSELDQRLFNISPASFIEEFLELGENRTAKNYLRSGKTLFCTESFTLNAVKLFAEYDDKAEANILFNLSEPECVTKSSIIVNNDQRFDEILDLLKNWAQVASLFYNTSQILLKINNIEFLMDEPHRHDFDTKELLRVNLLLSLGQGLVNQRKWNELDSLIPEFDVNDITELRFLFNLLHQVIEKSLDEEDTSLSEKWLSILLQHFPKDKVSFDNRIYIADLVYNVTHDLELTKDWIESVPQPLLSKMDSYGYEGSLSPFMTKIKLNKLLNLCGLGLSITTAVPSVNSGSDEKIVVEFERMLCLITQLLTEGKKGFKIIGDIKPRITPIVRFFSRDFDHRVRHWYSLTQTTIAYFDFLVYAVSLHGSKVLNDLGDFLIQEFIQSPRYWSLNHQRSILMSLFDKGFDTEIVKLQLKHIEPNMLEGLDVDGRITECRNHAQAWLKLSENSTAKIWIQQAIKESFGVGYRKDYQFNSWIEWLQKINQLTPEYAKDRILWFVSNLRHIEETTEGRAFAYASEEILQSTLQCNLNAGRQQLEWQLDKGLINFQDGELAFICAYLESSSSLIELDRIIHFYSEIYLYVSTHSSEEIITSYLMRGFQLGGIDFLKAKLSSLIQTINIRAIESVRFNLLNAVNEFMLANKLVTNDFVSEFVLPKNPSSQSNGNSNELILKDKTQGRLTEKQVLEKVTDFEKLKAIIDLEDNLNSFFKWDKIIDAIGSSFSIEQIEELVKHNRLGRRESDFCAKLSNYALLLGNKQIAKELAEKAIFLSNDYGWSKGFDGGTRITAFLALKNVEPDHAISKAFEYLAHDSITHGNPYSITQQLEDILPCITKECDIKLVWDEVFSHLTRLMSNSNPIKDLPDLSFANRPISDDLFDHILYLTKSPATIIVQNAKCLFAHLLTKNDIYAIEILKELAIDKEENQEILINILMMIKMHKKYDVLSSFTSDLNLLAAHKNYKIRQDSVQILELLQISVPVISKIKLPPIYSLHLEQNIKPQFGVEEDSLNPKIDLNDPQDLIRPYGEWLDSLVERTGFEKQNLVYRMVTIMKEIDDPEKWTKEYEDNLRTLLNEIGLEYAYPRPRARAARRALMHIVSELIDASKITSIETEPDFQMHDYAIHLIPEIPQPEFINRLSEQGRSFVSSDWLSAIDSHPKLDENLIEYDGWVIIGKHSKVRSLAWGKPTETHMMKLVNRGLKSKITHHIFGSAFEILTDNYHEASLPSRNLIVFREHHFDQFDLKSRWLAINPVLARYLGWCPSSENLFAWEDEEGNTMVKSVYWSNGNIKMPPPQYDFEVGQGWFVLASKEALAQIYAVESDLIIERELKRYHYNDGYTEEKRNRIIELE